MKSLSRTARDCIYAPHISGFLTSEEEAEAASKRQVFLVYFGMTFLILSGNVHLLFHADSTPENDISWSNWTILILMPRPWPISLQL